MTVVVLAVLVVLVAVVVLVRIWWLQAALCWKKREQQASED